MSSNKPFPSSDLDVFKDNSLILDNFVNSQENEHPDRFGRKRPTITGIIKEAFNVRTDISNMNETLIGQSRWDAVPKNTSLSLGGDNGALNKQAQALFNRTEMLKVQAREALRRTYQEVGLNLVPGSFEEGGTLESSFDILLEEKTGKCYSWGGSVPKVVNKGTLPSSEMEFINDAQFNLNSRTITYFKNDLNASAVQNMIAGTVNSPDKKIFHSLGSLYCTGGTIWECINITKVMQISNFKPLSYIHGNDFITKIDGITDNTKSINEALDCARMNGVKVVFAGGRYKILGTVDISGITMEGVIGGYGKGSVGTQFIGTGTNTVLEQLDTSLPGLMYSVGNIEILNAGTAFKMRYGVHCNIYNITITDSDFGLIVGDNSFVGSLFCTFTNVRSECRNTALIMRGNKWCNANTFNTSFFKGDIKAGDIAVTGGYGAINNVFNNVEFTGDKGGLTLSNCAGNSFYSCYFESKHYSVSTIGAVTDLLLDHCVFGSVRNDGESAGSFIWHNTDVYGLGIIVNGGRVFSDETQPHYKKLKFITSVKPERVNVKMTDTPNVTGLSSDNFELLPNDSITYKSYLNLSGSFIPEVVVNGSAISGNSDMTGSFNINGNIVEVNIAITIGPEFNLSVPGDWIFRLPFASKYKTVDVSARIIDAGVRNYICGGQINQGSKSMVLYDPIGGLTVSRSSPFTIGLGDTFNITSRYTLN